MKNTLWITRTSLTQTGVTLQIERAACEAQCLGPTNLAQQQFECPHSYDCVYAFLFVVMYSVPWNVLRPPKSEITQIWGHTAGKTSARFDLEIALRTNDLKESRKLLTDPMLKSCGVAALVDSQVVVSHITGTRAQI